MTFDLFLLAAPAALMLILPILGCGIYLYERSQKKKLQTRHPIVDKVVEDTLRNPQKWTVRWMGSNVECIVKTMDAYQSGRLNEVCLYASGKLRYHRVRNTSSHHQASLDIPLNRASRRRLQASFASVIEAKMGGAVNQVVV